MFSLPVGNQLFYFYFIPKENAFEIIATDLLVVFRQIVSEGELPSLTRQMMADFTDCQNGEIINILKELLKSNSKLMITATEHGLVLGLVGKVRLYVTFGLFIETILTAR